MSWQICDIFKWIIFLYMVIEWKLKTVVSYIQRNVIQIYHRWFYYMDHRMACCRCCILIVVLFALWSVFNIDASYSFSAFDHGQKKTELLFALNGIIGQWLLQRAPTQDTKNFAEYRRHISFEILHHNNI